jgi:DNA-binding MarR family transcriptional regulator
MTQKNQSQDNYKFAGFGLPTTTPVPDQLFDELLFVLSPTEMVILLYIIRRTLGFRKQADNISLKQMESGIVTRDGKVLDRGTGLSKTTILRVLKSLEAKNIVFRSRRRNRERGDQPTTYRLNILGDNPVYQSDTPPVPELDTPVYQSDTPPVPELDTPVYQSDTLPVSELNTPVEQQSDTPVYQENDTQHTEKQGTEEQDTVRQQQGVADALTAFGIDNSTTNILIQNHSEAYLLEKIGHVRWMQATAPNSIKNPAGFLRRAIEGQISQLMSMISCLGLRIVRA